jgi:hypothetical protein
MHRAVAWKNVIILLLLGEVTHSAHPFNNSLPLLNTILVMINLSINIILC